MARSERRVSFRSYTNSITKVTRPIKRNKASLQYYLTMSARTHQQTIELVIPILRIIPPLTSLIDWLARVLTTFYCDKIQDADTVIPALEGLLTLASLSTFGVNEATDAVRAYVILLLFLGLSRY